MNLSKKSTNQEIQEAFATQLATGVAVVFAIDETANPEYVTFAVAQEIETPGSATTEQELFLGWGSNKSVARCLQNVKREQFDALSKRFNQPIAPGMQMTGFNIRITESTEPRSWIGDDGQRTYQEPKVYPASSKNAGQTIVTEDTRQKIYRNTELVFGAPTHTFLKGVPEKTPISVGEEVKTTFDELANA